MQVQLRDLFNSQQAFREIIQEKYDMKTSYWLTKTIKKVDKELQIFEETRRKAIIENGIKQEDNTYKLKEDKVEEVNKQIQDLLDTEVDLGNIYKINIDKLLNINVSPSALLNLEWLIEGELEDQEELEEEEQEENNQEEQPDNVESTEDAQEEEVAEIQAAS